MKKARFLAILFGTLLVAAPIAAQHTEHTPDTIGYHFPRIEPSLFLFAGYRILEPDAPPRIPALEYGLSENSLQAELRTEFFRYPDRFTGEVLFEDRKDYYLDVGYGYRDLLLARWVNSTVFHNLDRIELTHGLNQPGGVNPSDFGYFQRDEPERRYGTQTGIHDALFRLKAPNHAAHFYFNGFFVNRKGESQQRTLQGSAWFNELFRHTRARDAASDLARLRFGVNGHLGPVEADYVFSRKTYEPSGASRVLADAYGAATNTSGTVLRQAGTYLHNLNSETEGMTHTLRVHSSYTGKIVASGALSIGRRENRESGTSADRIHANASLTYLHRPDLAFFFKYRHRTRDVDRPDSVVVRELSGAVPDQTFALSRRAISSDTDRLSVKARFRTASRVTLTGIYRFENARRKNAEDWHIAPETSEHRLGLTASVRPFSQFRVKAGYTYRNLDDPAYNTDPNRGHDGNLALTWTPVAGLLFWGRYDLRLDERDALRFPDTNGSMTDGGRDRRADRFSTRLTYRLRKDLSVTAYYAYLYQRIEQGLAYHDLSGNRRTDTAVPYRDTTNSVGARIAFSPSDRLALRGGLRHTVSSARFDPGVDDLLLQASIASFTPLDQRETSADLSGEIELIRSLRIRLDYRYSLYEDRNENQPFEDGHAHVVTLGLSKKL